MPAKQKIPPPIDRPLSKAYLRQFTGWSTMYPPGLSDPTSMRIMENIMISRNGAAAVRPGLRYLSYLQSPDQDPDTPDVPGVPIDRPLVGTQEPFYCADGNKALLFAVREVDESVGFRALYFQDGTATVTTLEDLRIGFKIPQGVEALNFSSATTHVEYLQIDNKIVAMSDAGEPIRIFYVGEHKYAKALLSITVPGWDDSHKLSIIHPESDWINKLAYTMRYNLIPDPSFESSTAGWVVSGGAMSRTAPGNGSERAAVVTSLPSRTNMVSAPLHDVSATGTAGWTSSTTLGNPLVTSNDDWLKIVDRKGAGLFVAYSARIKDGVQPGIKYRVAVDFDLGTNVTPVVRLHFYNASGALIGDVRMFETPTKTGRFVSGAVAAPAGTTTMRVGLGGRNKRSASTFVKFKNLVLCRDGESTSFFSGASGTNYFWAGAVNKSASYYHPPRLVTVTSPQVPCVAGQAASASVYYKSPSAVSIKVQPYDRKNTALTATSAGAGAIAAVWTRVASNSTALPAASVTAKVVVNATLARGQQLLLDQTMFEPGASTPGAYFDGSTAGTATASNRWASPEAAFASPSVQDVKLDPYALPTAETPTAKTLVATGGATANTYKIGAFYTFENEVGESAPSKITEIRVSRPWSNWLWETANAAGEPSGAATDVADLCADQLVMIVPAGVYAQAISEGAIKLNLYVMSWSDQDPVPVTAVLFESVDLYPDKDSTDASPVMPHVQGGWVNLTPARKAGVTEIVLPTLANRENFSSPPGARTGLVAGDRMIMVGDPGALSTIRWTSNRPAEYTNFTPSKGGGTKTLTTGNLNIPAQIVLWQNPQSIDTITILCMGNDGQSNSYYMTPAAVNAQSGSLAVMGFEETTSTPGTLSPYGAQVMNNALYRPIDRALLKSTANNYNINHKTQTDDIANMWRQLQTKNWIMSAQLDNRLYLLVNNPQGALLEAGCKGNEIWVLDIAAENGHWSRLLIQASTLRPFSVGVEEYMGVTRPDGLYFLDHSARQDDYVEAGQVLQRAIPWRFETNTQGANRAHDAWAHLQQVSVLFGNFSGSARFGIRGRDINGFDQDVFKIFADEHLQPEDGMPWDVLDHLQVRRDMMEWFFYAESVIDRDSSGEIGFIQYRYTPVSVNVGYEYGSVETFEYGQNAALGADGYTENGIPVPFQNFTRP
jgi:hypothetical protein